MSTHSSEVTLLPLTLGQQFQAARERAGMNQDEFGTWLGTRLPRHRSYNRTAISRWETDKTIPPFDVVAALSEVSGWPIELFQRAAPPNPDPRPEGTPDLGTALNRWRVHSPKRHLSLVFQGDRVLDRTG